MRGGGGGGWWGHPPPFANTVLARWAKIHTSLKARLHIQKEGGKHDACMMDGFQDKIHVCFEALFLSLFLSFILLFLLSCTSFFLHVVPFFTVFLSFLPSFLLAFLPSAGVRIAIENTSISFVL